MNTELQSLIEKAAEEMYPVPHRARMENKEKAKWEINEVRAHFRAGVNYTLNSPDILKAAGLEKKEDWISVEDRMPDHNFGVLVFIPDEDFHVTSGMWDISNKWVLLDEYREPECKVTHWMKLTDIPEPYKTEQQEHFKILKAMKYLLPPTSPEQLNDKE